MFKPVCDKQKTKNNSTKFEVTEVYVSIHVIFDLQCCIEFLCFSHLKYEGS